MAEAPVVVDHSTDIRQRVAGSRRDHADDAAVDGDVVGRETGHVGELALDAGGHVVDTGCGSHYRTPSTS